jgi:hypothetical protein
VKNTNTPPRTTKILGILYEDPFDWLSLLFGADAVVGFGGGTGVSAGDGGRRGVSAGGGGRLGGDGGRRGVSVGDGEGELLKKSSDS